MRAAFGLVVSLLLLLIVEGVLRLGGVTPAYQVEALGRWRMAPGQVAQVTQGPRDGHTFRVSTNADGLRTTVPVERTPGRSRVVLLGDSTVFGWGVDDGGTVADGAQAALGPSWEVINAGQPGYSTTMAAWLYGEVVQRYQPDLTVVFLPEHDNNRVLVSDREVLAGGATPVAALRIWLARESRLYTVLRKQIFDAADRAWLTPVERSAEPRVARVSDAERELALADIQAAMAPSRGRLAIGYLPFLRDLAEEGGPDRLTSAWARRWTAARDVPLYELQRCCRGVELVLPDDPGHLTAEGNARVGAALADKISLSPGFR